jgi:hypothetical protein
VTVTCRGPEPETAPTHGVTETPEIVGRCTITVDGLDVTAHAVRCRVGTSGWVEVYRTNPASAAPIWSPTTTDTSTTARSSTTTRSPRDWSHEATEADQRRTVRV